MFRSLIGAAALLFSSFDPGTAGARSVAGGASAIATQDSVHKSTPGVDPWAVFEPLMPGVATEEIPEPPPSEREFAVSRKRSILLDGKRINYRVTAGTLILREDDGSPAASVFYTAYTVPPLKGANRPVTFLFNGGPGVSTMFLHVGSVAPIKADAPPPGLTSGVPIRTNPDSIIDRTDLVFIDAVETGFSRTLPSTDPRRFHGVDYDIDGFARAIGRYVAKFDRHASPKFLVGESYGTIRAAGLTYALQKHRTLISGVVLISSVLNMQRHVGGLRYAYFLPTYTATAWYHGKIAKQEDLADWVQRAKAFASDDYKKALQAEPPPAESERIGRAVSAFSGLPLDVVLSSDYRVEALDFMLSLLRDRGLVVGRLDSRYTTPNSGEEGGPPDPSNEIVSSSYFKAIQYYFAKDLRLRTGLNYRPRHNVMPLWKDRRGHMSAEGYQDVVNTTVDLAAAMRANSRLKVLSVNGYYDLATPFFGTDEDLAGMQIPPELRRNIHYAYFRTGHMVYIEPSAASDLRRHLVAFYDDALKR